MTPGTMSTVKSTIFYLEQLPLYARQKPYMLTFEGTGDGCPNTNHSYVPRDVLLEDVRGCEAEYRLDTHGFEFHTWGTALSSADFDDDNVVKTQYYPEVLQHMRSIFPEPAEVHILTHLRRKRRASVLAEGDTERNFKTPIVYAHTGVSIRPPKSTPGN